MSTAGKVLSVVIFLAMAGWMVLISMLATLNTNYGKKLTEENEKLVKVQESLQVSKDNLFVQQLAVKKAQSEYDWAVPLWKGRLESATSTKATTTELQGSLSEQLREMTDSSTAARETRLLREKELESFKTELVAAQEDSKKEQDRNAKLREELGRLRQEFQSVLTENTQRLSNLKTPASSLEDNSFGFGPNGGF